MRGLLRSRAPTAVSLLSFFALWQAAVVVLEVPTYLLPTPLAILDAAVLKAPSIWRHSLVTTLEVLLGFGASVAVGVPLGVAVTQWRLFERMVYPILVALQSVPKLALGPLLIVWFGFGTAPKLVMVFLIAFFPIVVDTAVGLRSVAPETTELARSIGLGALSTFTKIRLPQALPSIFGGLKVAITLAVVGAVVGEFLGSDSGLGYLLVSAGGQLQTALLFAALIVLTSLGLALYAAVSLVERLTIPWAAEEHTSA